MDNLKNKELALGLTKEHDQAVADKAIWTEHYDEVSKFGVPRKDNVYGQRPKGEKNNPFLFTGYLAWAITFVASVFHGMLTSPMNIWFDLTTGDPELDDQTEVRQYLDKVVRLMIGVLNGSNFQTEIHETYEDLASLGSNILDMEEDDEEVIRFRSAPIYEGTLRDDNRGDATTSTREFAYSIDQIEDEYGKIPKDIRMHLGTDVSNTTRKYKVIQVLKPRRHAENKGQLGHLKTNLPSGMEYVMFTVLREGSYILKTEGFFERPRAISRWSKTSDEEYGRSPSMNALADTKLLNSVRKVTIQAAQLAMAPPVETPDNGFLRPLKLKPFGVNYRRPNSKMETRTIYSNARPDIGIDFSNDIKEDIKLHFFIDQLKTIVQDRMTATEVIQRRDEQFRVLGPLLGRLHRELLKPIIDRLFGIMERRGLLPEPPEALKKNGLLKIRYLSAIAKAQMANQGEDLNRSLMASQSIIEVQPEVMDNIDGDKVLKTHMGIYGVRADFLRSTVEVKKIREDRAKAQQEEIARQDTQEDASMMKDIGDGAEGL